MKENSGLILSSGRTEAKAFLPRRAINRSNGRINSGLLRNVARASLGK